VIAGPLQPESWTAAPRPAGFFALKGVVETTLGALGLEAEFAALGESAAHFPYLHPGKSATVTVPKAGGVGVAGMLRPDVAAVYGVDGVEVFVAMLALDRIAAVALPTPAFEDLGAYPSANQDLAVVVGRDVTADGVVAVARRAGGKLVRSVRVFDVYEGDQVAADKRSLALRVVMRSPERTLGEKDIATVRAKILAALEREFAATLR
jgi:phenylalanyl-tRNA synthetase beta chain